MESLTAPSASDPILENESSTEPSSMATVDPSLPPSETKENESDVSKDSTSITGSVSETTSSTGIMSNGIMKVDADVVGATQKISEKVDVNIHHGADTPNVTHQLANEVVTESKASNLLSQNDVLVGKPKITGNNHDKSATAHNSPKKEKKDIVILNRGEIDTAAPFESVKEAVTRFGGIVDWKQQKILNMEKRQFVEAELQRIQKELPELKKQLDSADDEKEKAQQELDQMKKLVDELTLKLERARVAEQQAMQDSELARLRVEEMEKGATDEVSDAWKTQLQAAKARHAATVAELQSVKGEVETLKLECQRITKDRDDAVVKANAALHAFEETDQKVDTLALELLATKDSLDTAHAAHHEAEEQRLTLLSIKERESEEAANEIKLANQELESLKPAHASFNDLQSKLKNVSSLLESLKEEVASYKGAESKLSAESVEVEQSVAKAIEELEQAKAAESKAKESLHSVGLQSEEVNMNLNKVKEDFAQITSSLHLLREELEKEKTALAMLRQREGMASVAISALEAELKKTNEQLESAQDGERQANETMAELPNALKEAAAKAEEAKALAEQARLDMQKSKEEMEQAKAAVGTVESRLHATMKETEAAKASEAIALTAVKALKETESAQESSEIKSSVVKLSFEEYCALCKKAHDAQEIANKMVQAEMEQVHIHKENKNKVLKKLEEAKKEKLYRKEALQSALEKANNANAGKLAVEGELRKWRAENEQRRKTGDLVHTTWPSVAPKSPGGLDNSKQLFNENVTTGEVGKGLLNSEDIENIYNQDNKSIQKKKKKSILGALKSFVKGRNSA